MSFARKFTWIALVSFVLFSIPQATGLAADLPQGFKRVDSALGVGLYRKDYPGGTPDYVQVVDLSQGAAVKLMVGEVREPREEKGSYGGADPRILSQSLSKFWRQALKADENTFCVFNGSFFYMKESPTRLPFPIKLDGAILSDGYGKVQFPGQKLILELWDDRADIRPLTKASLYHSTAPNILGGLAEDARKSPKHYVARTFVGVTDKDGDGKFEIVLVFNTQTARQEDAAEVLRSFGAEKVMMLDGGGSTQLTCKEEPHIASDRLIPQAVAVLAGVKKTNPNYLERAQLTSPRSDQGSGGNGEAARATSPELSSAEISGAVQLSNVVWVPLGITPLAAFLLLVITRRRQEA